MISVFRAVQFSQQRLCAKSYGLFNEVPQKRNGLSQKPHPAVSRCRVLLLEEERKNQTTGSCKHFHNRVGILEKIDKR